MSQGKPGRLLPALTCLGGLVVLGALGGIWLAKRHRNGVEADARRNEVALGPRVEVATVELGAAFTTVTLTGESRPYAEVTLNARVAGYLTYVGVDKGDPVQQDQVLAVVAAPETTEQYRGALADAANKKEIAGRMRDLREKNLISPQEYQQAASAAQIAAARVGEIAVNRGYQVLKAPFAGTITARYVDPGALVQTAATALFRIAQLDRLRIYAYVDQKFAARVRVGDQAELSVPERPDRRFAAAVTRLAGELDPQTRMMLVEIDYDNRQGELVAGSYVTVKLQVAVPPLPEVPLDAVTQEGDRMVAPVLERGDRVRYRTVEVGENDGHVVQIKAGLRPHEVIVRNLGASVPDGSHVQVVQPGPPRQGTPDRPTTSH